MLLDASLVRLDSDSAGGSTVSSKVSHARDFNRPAIHLRKYPNFKSDPAMRVLSDQPSASRVTNLLRMPPADKDAVGAIWVCRRRPNCPDLGHFCAERVQFLARS